MENATTKPSSFQKTLAEYLDCLRRLEGKPANEQALLDSLHASECSLLEETPQTVADLRALAEIIWQDQDGVPSSEMLRSFFRALRTLTGGEPSQTFDAGAWLNWFETHNGGWIERDGDILLLWPEGDNAAMQLDDLRFVLETRAGHAQVIAEIRRRQIERESKCAVSAPSWSQSVAAYEAANADLNAAPDDEEQLIDTLVDARTAAIETLFATPAPDCSAVAFKLSVYQQAELQNWNKASRYLGLVSKDAERLAA